MGAAVVVAVEAVGALDGVAEVVVAGTEVVAVVAGAVVVVVTAVEVAGVVVVVEDDEQADITSAISKINTKNEPGTE